MVAISLYRGNLHRVSDVPRRWAMPPPTIFPRDFRLLLLRRSKALSLREPPAPPPADCSEPPQGEKEEGMGDNGCPKPPPEPETAGDETDGGAVERLEAASVKGEEAEREGGGGDREEAARSSHPASTSAVSKNLRRGANGGNGDNNLVGDAGASCKMEACSLEAVNETEERKTDLKKKLDVLNEKKHHLVQMLKQILNAEEEIKRRISIQPPPIQASASVQAETAIDTSSVMKHAAPRMSLEVNISSDVAGESEEIASHNTQLRHSQHMYSTSPSAASAFNRPVHGFLRQNSVNTPRASSTSTGATSNVLLGSSTPSPSRFAPSGHQGHTTSLPPLSISGTHFLASSPSPAGSGGASSVFRDSRLTSP